MGRPTFRDALWFALKPGSWPKLLVPAWVGACAGKAFGGNGSAAAALGALAYTWFLAAGIVLLNDWADVAVDRIKRERFPELGGPKTIPDGILGARSVFRLGTAGMCAAAGTAVWIAGAAGRVAPAILGVAGPLLLVAYSVPPIRVNGRGGGEGLEAVGVGFVLPAFVAVTLGAPVSGAMLAVFVPYVLLSLASAVASGLADEPSDRMGGKRTVVTRWGNHRARRVVETCVAWGAAAYVLVAYALAGRVALPFAWGAFFYCLVVGQRLLRLSPAATTDAPAAIRAYKAALHRGIWGSGLLWGVGLWASLW